MLFFMFRDGDRLAQAIARAIPLDPRHTHRLLQQFATVVRATNGFGIGPVIAAVLLVSWEMLASVRQQQTVPGPPPLPPAGDNSV